MQIPEPHSKYQLRDERLRAILLCITFSQVVKSSSRRRAQRIAFFNIFSKWLQGFNATVAQQPGVDLCYKAHCSVDF